MTGNMLLIMAQVDDASGELLGNFIKQLENLGARNIQAVSSLTKKGRPGYILFIDVDAELETEVAFGLASELGIWGYRVLHADHHHFDIQRETRALTVRAGGDSYRFDLRAKWISRDGEVMRVKAEHDDLSGICSALRTNGHKVPLAVLKSLVENELWKQKKGPSLSVEL